MFYLETGGDTIEFFNTASQVCQLPYSGWIDFYFSTDLNKWNLDSNRSAFFIKCIIPFVYMSGSSYWISSVLLSSFSCIVLLVLIDRYYLLWKDPSILYLAFFAFPSVLIWTSGIFKESLALIFLILSFLPILEYKRGNSNAGLSLSFLISIVSILFFYQIRYFLIIPFILFILIFLLFNPMIKSKGLYFGIISILLLISTLILIYNPVLNLTELPSYIYQAHETILNSKTISSDIQYDLRKGGWYDLILNMPEAFLNLFIRPFPWEWTKLEYVLYSIENYVLIILILYSFIKYREHLALRSSVILILFSSMIIIALATPNFGSLFRYKSLFIPFIIINMNFNVKEIFGQNS